MRTSHLDHLVLTVKDIPTTVNFYTTLMGMQVINFGQGRTALSFGSQKINLHQIGNEFEPKASNVAMGSANLCFIIDTPIKEAVNDLQTKNIPIIKGPIKRTGAMGQINSIYFRDPDGNLIEVSNYIDNHE